MLKSRFILNDLSTKTLDWQTIFEHGRGIDVVSERTKLDSGSYIVKVNIENLDGGRDHLWEIETPPMTMPFGLNLTTASNPQTKDFKNTSVTFKFADLFYYEIHDTYIPRSVPGDFDENNEWQVNTSKLTNGKLSRKQKLSLLQYKFFKYLKKVDEDILDAVSGNVKLWFNKERKPKDCESLTTRQWVSSKQRTIISYDADHAYPPCFRVKCPAFEDRYTSKFFSLSGAEVKEENFLSEFPKECIAVGKITASNIYFFSGKFGVSLKLSELKWLKHISEAEKKRQREEYLEKEKKTCRISNSGYDEYFDDFDDALEQDLLEKEQEKNDEERERTKRIRETGSSSVETFEPEDSKKVKLQDDIETQSVEYESSQ